MQCLGMGEHVHKHLFKKESKKLSIGVLCIKTPWTCMHLGQCSPFPPSPTADENNPSFQPLLSSHLIHN